MVGVGDEGGYERWEEGKDFMDGKGNAPGASGPLKNEGTPLLESYSISVTVSSPALLVPPALNTLTRRPHALRTRTLWIRSFSGKCTFFTTGESPAHVEGSDLGSFYVRQRNDTITRGRRYLPSHIFVVHSIAFFCVARDSGGGSGERVDRCEPGTSSGFKDKGRPSTRHKYDIVHFALTGIDSWRRDKQHRARWISRQIFCLVACVI